MSSPDLARLLVRHEIEEFLYREADLLDERRFAEWLDLFTEDAHYWMPMRRNVPHDAAEREFTREGTDVNWFDEGKETLARRVQQILTGIHWAEEPPSRICHMISNVQILSESPAGQVPAEVAVKSRFLVYRNRVETETDVLVGKREAIVGHVLFYDVLPALLTWVVGSTAGLDLFSAIDNPSLRRLAGLGLFLSVVAAIITTESVTRLARPFSIGHFLTTVVLIGAALFPTLADWHRLRLGLTPEQFALVQAYCYLALKVMVGILIGATLSWILQARYARLVSSRRPEYTRK